MAEGEGRKTERQHTLSLGSDFVFDFSCELCTAGGKHVEAEGFCVDCDVYLCGVCYNVHSRNRQTRHHHLLDRDRMPKDNPLSSERISKSITSKCKFHAGELIRYYCKTHDVLGCNTCFVTCHRNCPEVHSIIEKSENILDRKEYTDLIKTLSSLDKKSHDVIEMARAYTSKSKNCYTEVIKSVKLLRENVNEILDKLEQDIVTEADTLVSEEEKKMAIISNNCNTVSESIETLLADFQSLHSSRRVCQVYISMKEMSTQIKVLQDKVRKAEEALAITTFKFEPNKTFQDFIENPPTLGKISSKVQRNTARPETETDKPVPVKIAHVADISGMSGSISGAAVLSPTRLVVLYNTVGGGMIKLLDTQANKVVSKLNVPSYPWDVTVINRNKVAVTFPNVQKIILLNISENLKIDREITVDGECRGVAYSKGRLVVSYTGSPKLELMDLSGSVMTGIIQGSCGNQLFQSPGYVCVSKDGETIYVSDQGSNKVTSLTFEGIVKSVYSDTKLKGIWQVCVDHHGNIYVYGSDTNVHMLTAHLTMIKTILTQADGVHNRVRSLCHCQETNRLYVGMRTIVKVFQLS